MRIKDIQPGKAYAKRKSYRDWGVPVSLPNGFEVHEGRTDSLWPGQSILILSGGASYSYFDAKAPAPGSIADAIAVADSLGKIRPGTKMDELDRRIRPHGLHAELWTAAQVEGEFEKVVAEREAERRRSAEERAEAGRRTDSLAQRWESVRAALDLDVFASVGNSEVIFYPLQFEKLLQRLEALVDANPLIDGKL